MGGFYSTLLAFNAMIRFALCTNLTDTLNRSQNEELNRMLYPIVYKRNPDSNATSVCGGTTGRKYCCGFYYDGCTEHTHKASIDRNKDLIAERPSVKANSDIPKVCCECCYSTAKCIVDLLQDIVSNAHESNDGTYFVVIRHTDPMHDYILCSNNADEFILASIETGEDGKYSFSPATSVKINAWTTFIRNPFNIKTVPIAELSMELEESVKEGTASLKILKTNKLITVEEEFEFGSGENTPKQDEADPYECTEEESAPTG